MKSDCGQTVRGDRTISSAAPTPGSSWAATRRPCMRLWREKRGEVEPEDLSGNLIVQLGLVDRGPQPALVRAQHRPGHHGRPAAGPAPGDPLDGGDPRRHGREAPGRCSRPSSCCPGRSRRRGAAEKHMAQLQHNMWVTNAKAAVLSIITGGGKWVEITISRRSALPAPAADGREEVLALRRERRAPSPVRRRATRAPDRGGADRRYERVQFLGGICRPFRRTRAAYLEHETAKAELKSADAGGRQGGDRPRRPGQALEIRRGQLRSA